MRVFVNGKPQKATRGMSILDVCEGNSINVPTICYHPSQKPPAVCRVCLVQVGDPNNVVAPPPDDAKLVPACATPAQEGASYWTNTGHVREGIQSALRLLLARHPVECPTCDANNNCLFQELLYRYGVKDDKFTVEHKRVLREHWRQHRKNIYDASSPAIVRDMEKCILCTKCIQQCHLQGVDVYGMALRGNEEFVSTYNDQPVYNTECISCGQCSYVCPTGAIIARSQVVDTLDLLDANNKITVIQIAPSVRVAIAEEFNLDPGAISVKQLCTGLKKIGFKYIFDTDFTADLTIVEEGTEFLKRLQSKGPFPMFTSCCPAWVNWVEKKHPELIPNLSSARSPQAMMGSLIKTYFADKIGVSREDIVVVSLMPCTAKKDEAQRPQLAVDGNPDVDIALTTRELGRLFKMRHVHLASLPESELDDPLGLATGAGVIFGVTGGVMEAALRSAYELATHKQLPRINFTQVRGFEGIRTAEIDMDGLPVKVAVAHGMGNAKALVEKILKKEAYYDFIEMMACPGGCIGGGGEPKTLEKDILKKRMAAVYSLDERAHIRKSHENPGVKRLYEELLGEPNSHKAHHLLHTHYADRSEHSRKDVVPPISTEEDPRAV